MLLSPKGDRSETIPWDVTPNAMSWGARNPKHLLLGVSKGPNQYVLSKTRRSMRQSRSMVSGIPSQQHFG
jgi:hypothetical protein